MLKITGDIAKLLKTAASTGSLEALTAKLEYLNGWGQDSTYTVQVDMVGIDEREAGLRFMNTDGKTMMVGGLIYHETSNTWGYTLERETAYRVHQERWIHSISDKRQPHGLRALRCCSDDS